MRDLDKYWWGVMTNIQKFLQQYGENVTPEALRAMEGVWNQAIARLENEGGQRGRRLGHILRLAVADVEEQAGGEPEPREPLPPEPLPPEPRQPEPNPNYPNPNYPVDREQRQRQIYGYRDRLQPARAAQPSIPAEPRREREGRPYGARQLYGRLGLNKKYYG